jgi:hypothetical protein
MVTKTAFEAVPTVLSLTVVLQICGNGLPVCGSAFKSLGLLMWKWRKESGALLQLNESC